MDKTAYAAFMVYAVASDGEFLWLDHAQTHEDASTIVKDFNAAIREEGVKTPYAGCFIVPATFIPACPDKYGDWLAGD